MKRSLLILLLCIAGMRVVHAQYAVGDLDLDKDVSAWFDEVAGSSRMGLYEGTYFVSDVPVRTPNTHVFYGEPYWSEGIIEFRNQVYKEIYSEYDVLHDVLLVRNPSIWPAQALKLNQSQVSNFILQEAEFRYYAKPDSPSFGEGFYHVLHDGESIRMIVKRRKVSQVVDNQAEYVVDDRYFMERDGRYTRLLNRKSLLNLFPEYKTDLRRYARSMGLKIRPGNDHDIRLFLDYCEEVVQ